MLEIKSSNYVNGKGVFTDSAIPSGELIGIWASTKQIGRLLFQDGMSEPWYESQVLGRYVNHSDSPNTEVRINGDSLFLYSTGIEANCEITVDYSNSENLIGYKANINF